VQQTGSLIDVHSLEFWKSIERALDPEQSDEWIITERATQNMLMNLERAKHVDEIERIAKKSGGVNISWTVKSNSQLTPVSVDISGSFSEKHKMKAQSDLPDPNAQFLPGMDPTESKEEVGQSNGSDPDPENTEEQSPEGDPKEE